MYDLPSFAFEVYSSYAQKKKKNLMANYTHFKSGYPGGKKKILVVKGQWRGREAVFIVWQLNFFLKTHAVLS